jgi:hypothetical protein
MAKKRKAGRGVNKAEKIRELAKNDGSLRNVDIVAKLAAQGIKVTPNYVSITRTKSGMGKKKRRGGRRRGGRGSGRGRGRAAAMHSDNGVGLEQMREAARLIRSAGGIDGARQALAVAEQIAKALV